VIAIAGRWGTLNEVSEALMMKKPLVFLMGTDGIIDDVVRLDVLSDEPFVDRASSAHDAVEKALRLIQLKSETKD
jgi:hypothetical protein